jgi:hypothetical protein
MHLVPAPGMQSYVFPDASSQFAHQFHTGTDVQVLEVRAAWAYVRSRDGQVGWLDGRLLVPPAAAYYAATGAPVRPRGGGAAKVVGLVGSIGVMVGSAAAAAFTSNWMLPFIVTFVVGLVGFVTSLLASPWWVRIVCGSLAAAIALLSALGLVTPNYGLTFYGQTGAWVVVVFGVLLAISPMLGPRRS